MLDGSVVGEAVATGPLLDDTAPTDRASIGFRFELALEAQDLLRTKAGLEELVAMRNEFVHHPIDFLIDGRVQLIMNTPRGKGARTDEGRIRAASVMHGAPCITTLPAAEAVVRAMEAQRETPLSVQAIQDRFPEA